MTGKAEVLGERRVPLSLRSTVNLTWTGLGSNREKCLELSVT
jgi:hypothetical protein